MNEDSRFTREPFASSRDGYSERAPPPFDEEEADGPLPRLVPLKRVKGRVREWAVPGWIPKRTATLIQGDGGLGKSTLLQQLQSSCATSLPWLGLPIEECVSLGVYTEDEDLDLDIRQDAIDAAYRVDCAATGRLHMLARAGEDSELVVFSNGGNPTLTPFYRQVCEAASDYKARLVTLDVAVDLYGGDEIRRRQVRAFMRALGGLARKIDGAVVTTTHVSQSGIKSEGGHSGSTDWSNAARSRAYLSAPKNGGDSSDEPDARILTRKKANHARIGDTIKMRWNNGVFVPDGLKPLSHFRRPVEEVFLALLDALESEGQKVSAKPRAGNYGPTFFMKRSASEREDYYKSDFERALQALFKDRKIRLETYGRPSWGYERIVRARQDQ